MWIIRSNHEKASAGPFFRSLLRRGSDGGEDLYEIYYYSMGNTDVERFGLQGPTVLSFTDGGTPSSALFARNADWSWFDGLSVSSSPAPGAPVGDINKHKPGVPRETSAILTTFFPQDRRVGPLQRSWICRRRRNFKHEIGVCLCCWFRQQRRTVLGDCRLLQWLRVVHQRCPSRHVHPYRIQGRARGVHKLHHHHSRRGDSGSHDHL